MKLGVVGGAGLLGSTTASRVLVGRQASRARSTIPMMYFLSFG